jgi:hypothetical protein
VSLELTRRAWRARDLRPAERLVLLYLADSVSRDFGNAYIRKQAYIATATELHADTVKDALSRLTALGHLSRQTRRGAPTTYIVHPLASEGSDTAHFDKGQHESGGAVTPQFASGDQSSRGSETPHFDQFDPVTKGSVTPATKGPETPQVRGNLPPRWGVIDPSITVLNDIERADERFAPERTREEPDLPHWWPTDAWTRWLDHRLSLGTPFSSEARSRAIARLTKLRSEGHDPAAVLVQSIAQHARTLAAPKEIAHGSRSSVIDRQKRPTVASSNPLVRAAARFR